MRELGFDVTVDHSAEQLPLTCGIVAPHAAVDMFTAVDWRTCDVRRAVEIDWLRAINRKLGLFTSVELESSSAELLDDEALRLSCGEPSRMLMGAEVLCAAAQFWQQAADQLPPRQEAPGPPCDRCDGRHLTALCPMRSQPRSRDSSVCLLPNDIIAYIAFPSARF